MTTATTARAPQTDTLISLPALGPDGYGSRRVAAAIDVDCPEVRGILRIRGGATLGRAGIGVLSTSETITVLLGAGTPAALRRLARDWDARGAWNRIDARQRAIVLAAWSGDLDTWECS